MSRCGVLLINVGTPDACSNSGLRRYLTQFLMDRRIIELPWLWRSFVVKVLIVPIRARLSARKYQEIWQEQGSPLMAHSIAQRDGIQKKLGRDFHVALAMRYGEPSIKRQVKALIDQGCEKLIVVPLFPQYSSAATGSAIEEVFKSLKGVPHLPEVKTFKPFFRENFFLEAKARLIAEKLNGRHLILSFHGLPHTHIARAHAQATCKPDTPCPSDTAATFCYRAQCFLTAHHISQTLEISASDYSVCFQSRLGVRAWVEPYLFDTLRNLISRNILDVVVACPAFVSDCLETLHEIGIDANARFKKMGGKSITLVPCLNDDDKWLTGLSDAIYSLSHA